MTRRMLESKFANELLNRLEDLELPLLAWGMTEGALSQDDVLDTIEEVRGEDLPGTPVGTSAQEILSELRSLALIFRVPSAADSSHRYRTRLAETLRLAVGLRQLFPPRRGQDWSGDAPPPGWWRQSPRLVADYRLHVRHRRYPTRNIDVADALKELRALPHWGELQERVATAQLQGFKLARFQMEATQAIYTSLARRASRGVIVGAGTGSGKTLAFYLPAFAAIAAGIRSGAPGRVHTLALYPRKELLRDQLREAVQVASRVEDVLREGGKRPIRIGALYGDTPWNASDDRLTKSAAPRAWTRIGDSVVCPFLPCPNPECANGDLLWYDQDRNAGKERLSCNRCRYQVQDGRLALTRDSLKRNPPDLLFTTTEMLNQCSSDGYLEHLLGWRGGAVPSLVLLDEVHTYTGVHGAQVALLLRRWREAAKKPVTFVGLSATLRDADRFFAQLVGLRQSDVESVAPLDDAQSMTSEGREYAIALRGDPVSGTSLLSTSIQAAMLFGRTLDPEGDSFLYGSTGFLFTDDLDVTNRFYKNLRDAEGGQNHRGQRTNRRSPGVLAGLRSRELPEPQARYEEAQSWDIVEEIGHELDPTLRIHPLRIGRTSSQDVGVDHAANLTVATASLEVGFNDPRVGLVLQHKAPRNAASFIQRRGRAGRERGTRPLTVVTLSDYGRDRLAYQGYETLFAPEVSVTNLPLHNRYVLKIQGAQALLDWAGRMMRTKGIYRGDPRKLLTAPKGGSVSANYVTEHEALAAILAELLSDQRAQDHLAKHLVRALQISPDEAQAVMWEQPRSILLAVAPTALRRLRSNWKPVRTDPGASEGAMLPEYITRALFEPLNLPEVSLALPFEHGGVESMPIGRALAEAVPGRVSRRFGHARDEHRTWLPLPPEGSNTIDLRDMVADGQPQGSWQPHGQSTTTYAVVRPQRISLLEPPRDIADQSQATPVWGTQIVIPDDVPLGDGPVPKPSAWQQRIDSVGFATHAAGNPIEVRRLTTGAKCEVRYEHGGSENRRVQYELRGEPAALGFRLGVDAARFQLKPLNFRDPEVGRFLASPQWRALAFTQTVAEDPDLAGISNTFQRDRLAQIYLTAFALVGFETEGTATEVRATLMNGGWSQDLAQVFQVLYRDADVSEQAVDNDRLVAGLSALAHDDTVIAAVDRASELLVAPDITSATAALAQRAYRDTVAAAILSATQRACTHAQDGDLIVDTLPGDHPEALSEVWLSETSVGGLGLVEYLVRYYSEDPRRFWELVTSSLAPSEYEYVDATLTRLLRHVTAQPTGTAAQAMEALRSGASAADTLAALEQLRQEWTRLDGPPRHAAVAALSTRLLRPGSGPATDMDALALVNAWTDLERRLGVEVDARVVAYAVGSGRLSLPGGRALNADQVSSMLWPRGRQARIQDLQHYQPYAASPVLERLLVQAAHDDRLPRIDVTDPTWVQRYQAELTVNSAVELVCPGGNEAAMAQALSYVPVIRVDRDVLGIYGEVRGILRQENQIRVRVELREASQ
ncbi:protein DpdJ [Streptomyces polygonati]|uniref:Protein DpdJ n=1 Tax=Streptomyces polygonati TaxID=1617087 RepID=A0ABV8HRL9_9ACTN